MKAKLILLCLFCTLVWGCKKDDSLTRTPTFNITNNSSGIVKQVDIKLAYGVGRIHVSTLTNLDISETETTKINLSSFDIEKGDAGYFILVTLADDKKIEKSFGYITNGVDVDTRPYNVEISNSEVILK
ncbi:MAG TPA: hypothetical protein VF602_06875 [Pedobacter sp.]